LTEKASLLTESLNKYVFEVAVHANKIEIRKAIEELFGKKVVSVIPLTIMGKPAASGLPQRGTQQIGKRRL
jgi:large subunit ribosomal protein L23